MPTVRTEVMKRLRVAKGWSQEALAEKAIASLKTINSMENGAPAQLSTITKVARALGVEPGELLVGTDPPTGGAVPAAPGNVMPSDGQITLTLTLSVPFEGFDETEGLSRLIALLTSVAQIKKGVAVAGVSPGSVNVDLRVDPADVPAIARAVAEGKLGPVLVSEFSLPGENAVLFIAMLAASGFLYPPTRTVGGPAIRLRPPATGAASPSTPADADAPRHPDPDLIRQAVRVVTPDHLMPSFPRTVTLSVVPPGRPQWSELTALGERLESALAARTGPPLTFGRVETHGWRSWTGKMSVSLHTPDELRAALEATLTEFLGDDVRLVVVPPREEGDADGIAPVPVGYLVDLSRQALEAQERHAYQSMLSARLTES